MNNECERCGEKSDDFVTCPQCGECVCTERCIAGRGVVCFQCEEQR